MKLDHENDDTIMSNYPIKLIVENMARLAQLAINHQRAINGRIVCKSQAKSIVPPWICS
jgi:hypothetical protein